MVRPLNSNREDEDDGHLSAAVGKDTCVSHDDVSFCQPLQGSASSTCVLLHMYQVILESIR